MAIKKEIEIDVNTNTEAASNGFKKLKGAVENTTSSFNGLLKASGIIFIITKAFEFLKDAFSRNQAVLDGFSTALSVVESVMNKLVTAITDAFTSTNKATGGFDALGKVLSGTLGYALNIIGLAFNGIKLTILEVQYAWENSIFGGKDVGKLSELSIKINETTNKLKNNAVGIVDNAKKVINNFGEAVGEVVDGVVAVGSAVTKAVGEIDLKAEAAAAKRKTDRIASLNEAKIVSDGIIATLENTSEKYRQIRDNENISIKERTQANNDLLKNLDKQRAEVIKNFGIQKGLLLVEYEKNKTRENANKLLELANAKQSALNGVESQYSEQKQNINALTKENIELINSSNKAVVDAAKIIRDANQSIITDERARYLANKENLLSSFLDEEARLNDIITKSTEGTQAYQDALNERLLVRSNFTAENIKVDSSEGVRLKAKLDKDRGEQISQLDADIAFLDVKNQLTIAKELALYNAKREIERQRLVDGNATQQALTTFDQQTTIARIGFAEKEAAAKKDAYKNIGDALGALGEIAGKETAAGKTLGIAQALINTYIGVSEVIKSKAILPEPFNTITKVASIATTLSTGFKTIQALSSVQVPGGSSGGGSVASLSPSVNTAVSQTPQTQLALSVANAQKEPVRAYVVSSSLTTQQALDRNIKSAASFG